MYLVFFLAVRRNTAIGSSGGFSEDATHLCTHSVYIVKVRPSIMEVFKLRGMPKELQCDGKYQKINIDCVDLMNLLQEFGSITINYHSIICLKSSLPLSIIKNGKR